MNKVKMFFVATALLLVTAGVFAGRTKFADVSLYASNDGTHYYQLVSASASLVNLVVGSAHQAKITDQSGFSYGVYTYDNVAPGFVAVQANSAIW